MTSYKVAKLDGDKRLVGYREVKRLTQDHVEVPDGCDLPTDGTYRWDGKSFVPLGHGYGKPPRPPVASDYAMFLMMKAWLNDSTPPAECVAWVEWYELALAKRNEELRR